MNALLKTILIFAPVVLLAQGDTAKVVSQPVDKVRKLPGEFTAYQSTVLSARVNGYIDEVKVDVGSVVRKGQTLVTMVAPELDAQIAEAAARVEIANAQKAEAGAKLLAAEATRDRLQDAAQTPGAIAGNELVLAQKAVDAARGVVRSVERSAEAGQASVRTIEKLKEFLVLTAPFDGVVTERMLHPGALVGPAAGAVLKIEQTGRLRMVVAVPETEVAGIVPGARVSFTVPAHPGETFTGVVARLARVMDAKTRTMPVELDVANGGLRLAPGMYGEVSWPVRKARAALLLPPTSIVTTTERTFVIRVTDGRAQYVNVRKGAPAGELVEVMSADLREGDVVVRRANDEIREGAAYGAKR